MTSAREIVIGIDVGTTSMKAHAFELDGTIVGRATLPTVWDVGINGEAQIDVDTLTDTAIQVLVQAIPDSVPAGAVIGIGITGMAETGVLVDTQLRPIMPAIAWYDERGKSELQSLPADFAQEFMAHTGLGFKAECSFSKLLWHVNKGQKIAQDATWLNALEYIAFRLTGAVFTEPSLASRTGLLDQGSGLPWIPALEYLGATPSLLPEMCDAGMPFGSVMASVSEKLRGAVVTVAGHDHLVGAIGAGAISGDDLYNSCGTADVVLRSVSRTLTNHERSKLVHGGLSAGMHVVPGVTAILGATRSGLVLGRVMSMLGANDRESRRDIADNWDSSATHFSEVSVTEPPEWANEVTIALRGDVSPANVWSAAMRYTLEKTSELVHAVDDIAGPYDFAVAAGGWARIDGVYRGKSLVMPGLKRFDGEEPGARGAASLAALAAHQPNVPLTANLAASFAQPSHKELIS